VAGEQVADDLLERVQLGVAGLDQSGADVVSEPEVAPRRLGLPGARLRAALLIFGGGVAELFVIEPGAGEVRLLARRGRVAVAELLADEVEHERGVDDPDPGGKVLPALVHERVPAVAGAVAHIAGDAELERPALGAGGKRVELGVEPLELAAQDRGELALAVGGEVGAGVLDLHCAVEHRAVVDPDGVGVLVLDDGAVNERPEVLQRFVVQVGAGDPFCDGLGELRCELVHVGESVGHRHRELLAGRALGDTGADRIGERELAAEVVGALGRDAEVGADHGDSVGSGSPARASQQSRSCSCWSTSDRLSRWLACAWMRRISSAPDS
jgi:hypothetical protein